MNVLSLFDGMSCGMVALERAGIKVDKYYASEVDKYAIQISEKNYPDIIRLGDVTLWDFWNIDWSSIDLVIGGSPCQGFSFAGKQLAYDDPRSKLFFEFAMIIEHINDCRAIVDKEPVKFLLENVRMKKEHLAVISERLKVNPVMINSSLVSAQNRVRYYWSNWEFEQPKDKGIVLKDVIEDNPEDPTFLSETTVKRFLGYSVPFITKNKEKARCLTAMEYVKNGKQGNYLIVHNLYGGFKEKVCRVFEDKSPTLRTAAGGGHIPSVFKGSKEMAQLIPLEWLRKLVRKLTPIECERLMTLLDNYTEGVSNTQRYKMCGNGWTIDVIAHIFRSINGQT